MEHKNKFTVRDLDLYYGDFQALKKINMDIKEKEITAFIGPSGCGKSTFLKTINRMNDLVDGVRIDGQICMDGIDIYSDIDVVALYPSSQPSPTEQFLSLSSMNSSLETSTIL